MKTKNITKGILMMFIASLTLTSCGDEVNELQTAASVEAGAYARVVTSDEDKTTNKNDPNASSFSATIEFVDAKAGDLVESYTLFATFKDNTIASDTAPDYSILDEVMIESWDKAGFVTGEKYPSLDIVVNASDAISKLGLDLANADGGDTFVYRGEILLSDGRIFSSTNSGVSINAELFFNDAFSFTSKFICVPPSPITGDYIIAMNDNYGDGWQGSVVRITVDGVVTDYSVPDLYTAGLGGSTGDPQYVDATVTVTVPADTSSIAWEFVAGDYPGECSFKITTPSGAVGAEEGPGPAVGAIALNLCNG